MVKQLLTHPCDHFKTNVIQKIITGNIKQSAYDKKHRYNQATDKQDAGIALAETIVNQGLDLRKEPGIDCGETHHAQDGNSEGQLVGLNVAQ